MPDSSPKTDPVIPDTSSLTPQPSRAMGFGEFRKYLASQNRLPDFGKSSLRKAIAPPPATEGPLNILWIMADQLRADTLGYAGHPLVQTPNLDRLAARGVSFNRAYCSSPVCGPSRACTITGRYLYDHGVLDNKAPMKAEENTLPQLLAEAGYQTVNIGKVHCGRDGSVIWQSDSSVTSAAGMFDPMQYEPAVCMGPRKYSYRTNDMMSGRQPVAVEGTKSYRLVTASNAWFYGREDPRSFLFRVSFDDPHPPIAPPEPYFSMYDPDAIPDDLFERARESLASKPRICREFAEFRGCAGKTEAEHRKHVAAYLGLVTHLDAQIGRFLDFFAQTPIARAGRTMIVFNSDHGHMLGEHGLAMKGVWQYEGVSRVPTIFSMPGVLPEGVTTDALFDGTDFMPTILELAGVDVPQNVRGVSHVPVLTGKADAVRDHVFSQWEDYGFAVIGRRYKLCVYEASGPAPNWTNPQTLASSLTKENAELYDLSTDPLEKSNLIDTTEAQTPRDELAALLWKFHHDHADSSQHPFVTANPTG